MSLTRNIKTDDGAVGDGQIVIATLSITSGTKNLASSTNLWVSGDVGKNIFIEGAGVAGAPLDSTIVTFTDAKHVVINDNASTTLSSVSKTVGWATSDAAAFLSFNTWALANQGSNQITLTIPAGIYDLRGSPHWTFGVKDLITEGTGATLFVSNQASNIELGGEHLLAASNDLTGTSYFQTVNSGSSSVTLVTSAEDSRFSAGDWVLLMGVDLQKSGWPPNDAVFEYIQVSSSSGGVVTFSTPLQKSYKSTWPYYNDVVSPPGDKNAGGPATMIKLNSTWNASFDHRGFTLGDGIHGTPIYGPARSFKMTNVTILTAVNGGYAPSASKYIELNNVTQTLQAMENDKVIERLVINGGTFANLLSQSTDGGTSLEINSATLDIQGTTENTTLNNCTVNTFTIGGLNFGATQSVTLRNCIISNWNLAGANISNVDSLYTMANGIITVPKTETYGTPWAVPGTYCMFAKYSGGIVSEGVPFRILDITSDVTNVYVQTNLRGGFPTLPTDATNGLSIWNHPCPRFNGTGLTGSLISLDLSQAGAQNKPLGTYSKRVYDTAALLPVGSPSNNLFVFGYISGININVTKAYTGIHTPLTMHSIVAPSGTNIVNGAGALDIYDPIINLGTTGLRTIIPGTVTGTQVGDTITAPGVVWTIGLQSPSISSDISAESSSVWPSVEIEIITDQGVSLNLGRGLNRWKSK